MVCCAFLPPSGSDSDNSMIIVDVNYDEYALVHVIKTKGDVVTVVNKLYGKFIMCRVAFNDQIII